MKTYEQMMMEVMSMSDMNKIPGGTPEQRKIAQDRQRKREAKNSGTTTTVKPKPATKPNTSSSAITKTNVPVTKGGAITKSPQKSLPNSKGGSITKSRKSQMGKWSQGIKQSPGNLAKKSSSAVTPGVKKVKVTDDGREGQRGNRPGTTKPAAANPAAKQKDKKKGKGKGFKMPNLHLRDLEYNTNYGMPDTVEGGQLKGPDKGPADQEKK